MFVLGPADDAILQALFRYHYLTSQRICRLLYSAGSASLVRGRMKRLVDAEYCIPVFLPSRVRGGSAPTVYTLARKGVNYLRDQELVWSTRVQVGKPYRQTPLFRSEISYVVFNPTWTVPPGIIAADILPAAKRDPGAIAAKGLRVLDASGREVDPRSVDWSRFRSGNIPYTLRQDPGPKNALGRVKLMFTNPYFVYLHDTPSQALFERPDRAFSSGCVRVERALELAALVLDDAKAWNARTIDDAIARGKTQNVTLKRKIPVLLAYWTAWVDSEGRTNFRRDLYGQDAKWAAALDAPFTLRARPVFAPAPST